MQVIIDGTEYAPRAKPYGCSFGDAVWIKRMQTGMSRKAAAHACGISEQTLFRIEKRNQEPTLDVAARIALGLGLDISRLAETVLKNP